MKRLLIFLFALGALQCLSQQDPQYNMYQFNQLVINPAYAGAREGLSAVALMRNQWTGVDGAPQTACLSVHSPVLRKHIGLGLTVLNDRMGPRNWTGAYGNFAYIAKLSPSWKLSLGLNAGYMRYQFDFSKMNMKTSENLNFFSQTQSFGQLDFGTGLYLRSNKFFLGLSTTHFNNRPLYLVRDTSGLELKFTAKTHLFVTMGRSFTLSENLVFAPTIMLRSVQGRGNADLNLNFFLFRKAWLGVFVRGGYGPGFLMQYFVTDKVRVGYSYDTGLRDARRLGPSHEVMLGMDFSTNKSKVISPRFL